MPEEAITKGQKHPWTSLHIYYTNFTGFANVACNYYPWSKVKNKTRVATLITSVLCTTRVLARTVRQEKQTKERLEHCGRQMWKSSTLNLVAGHVRRTASVQCWSHSGDGPKSSEDLGCAELCGSWRERGWDDVTAETRALQELGEQIHHKLE